MELLFTINTNMAYGQNSVSFDLPHQKFEYKYSFKGPYLAQKDGAVPFWEYDGNAIASDDMVRITPSLRSKRGAIWTKSKTNFEWWQVEIWFRVTGRGRLGADGIAFWFTENRNPEGPVFGSADQWRGLGIFFDSFDNDAKGNNPYIMAMVNDGSKMYDHQSDGSSQQMAGCLRDFRNKPFPTRARIEYYKNVLTVMFHSGNSNNEDEFELCLRSENVILPQFGHFGLSAATGGLADDHDALKFLTTSLHPPGTGPSTGSIPDPDKQKIDTQYEQFKDKLEKQKEQYFKDHPDEAKKYREKEELDGAHEYETLGEKELQQIFDSQSQMYQALQTLNRKLDEILGRQERTLSLIGSGSLNMAQQQGGPTHAGQQQIPNVGLPIQRHEVEALLGSQREVLQSTRDIRTAVMSGHQGGSQGIASQQVGQNANPLHSQLLTEIRDGVNVLRGELATIGTKFMAGGSHHQPQQLNSCPQVSCASQSLMIILMVGQVACVIGYMFFMKGKNEHQKFY